MLVPFFVALLAPSCAGPTVPVLEDSRGVRIELQCTGATCEANLGKPNPAMLHTALEGVDVDLADCVMVGDRLQTDIRMGVDAGMAAALVLTGETTADDVRNLAAHARPPIVLDRIDRLLTVADRPD